MPEDQIRRTQFGTADADQRHSAVESGGSLKRQGKGSMSTANSSMAFPIPLSRCWGNRRATALRCWAMTLLKRRTGRPEEYCPSIARTGTFRCFGSGPIS